MWISKHLSESVSTTTWFMDGETEEQRGNFTYLRLPRIPGRNSNSILLLNPLDYIKCKWGFSCKSTVKLPQILQCNLQKKLSFSDPKCAVKMVCGILTQTWHESGKGSRLFWWPAQPFLLPRWAEATGSKLFTQVILDNFHSLQENCCPPLSFPGAWHSARAMFFDNLLFTFTLSTYVY